MAFEDFVPQAVAENAKRLKDALVSLRKGDGEWKANALNDAWKAGMSFAAAPAHITNAISVLIDIAASVAAGFLKIIGDARKESQPALNVLIAEGMTELLQVDIKSEDMPVGGDLQENAERAAVIGGKLHETLIKEFAPDGIVTPASGEKAARAFTGYNINLSSASSLLAILGEAFSFGQMENFREIGETIAKNLGLGRLHRMALKPLMDNTITKPYDRLLRDRYRQDVLSESQLVKAMRRGRITEGDVRQALAEKGYKNAYIEEILSEFTPHLSDSELERLVRHGAITQAGAIKEMQEEGWPADKAVLKLQAYELARTDSSVQTLVAEYQQLVKRRFMDMDTFRTVVNELPLTSEQKVWEIRIAGATLDFAHERVTQAELTSMLEHGIVDLTYMDEWAKGKGYSYGDALNLELLYFAKEKDKDAKIAAAKAKAERAAQAAAEKSAAKKQPATPGSLAGEELP